MPAMPLGAKPDSRTCSKPTKSLAGSTPAHSSTPMTKKPRMTAILIMANQYSNSPKPLTCARFTAVSTTTTTSPGTHCGTSNQPAIMAEAPVSSAPHAMMSRK